MQLSNNTSRRQCEGKVVEEQLRKFIDACECFSLTFEKPTDMVDMAQLCVFMRIVFEDISSREERLTIL